MKRFLILCALALALPALAQQTRTYSSARDAVRSSTSTGLVDWWQVTGRASTLISLFGYNSGSQQFILVFDSANGPTNIIDGFASATEVCTNVSHGLGNGDPLQITSTFAGLSAAIYYVGTIDADRFYLYDTKAHALSGGSTGRQDLTGSSARTTANRLPVHTFVIGSADNYSCIVPSTGIGVGRGLVIAVSTSGPLYTAGTKDVTALVTVQTP